MKSQTYVGAFVALAALTIIELLLFAAPFPFRLIVASLLSLAALKAVLIALFYMHLRYETLPVAAIPLIALLPAATLVLALLAT